MGPAGKQQLPLSSPPQLPGRSSRPQRCPLPVLSPQHGGPRYLQAEDVLALPQGHGLPQDTGAVGRARRNAALLTHTARAVEENRVGGKGDIHYQREHFSAFSSRSSAARVWDQVCPGGAMEGAAGRRGLPGAGWLPERPRSASLIASLTAVPSSAPTRALPSLSASRRRSETAAGPFCAGAGAARGPAALSVSRAPGAGRGRP